jgi:peroxiredoxin
MSRSRDTRKNQTRARASTGKGEQTLPPREKRLLAREGKASDTTSSPKPEQNSARQRRAQRLRQIRLRRVARWSIALVAVVVAGLIVWGLLTSRSGGGTAAAVSLPDFYSLAGQTAQDFTLRDTSNNPIALSSFHGQRVLINFWYAACPGCKTEMPDFATFYQQAKGQNIIILGVNILDDANTASQFMQQVGVTYPVVFDPHQRVFSSFNLTSTPSSILVDTQGVIRGSVSGPLSLSQLRTYFAQLH